MSKLKGNNISNNQEVLLLFYLVLFFIQEVNKKGCKSFKYVSMPSGSMLRFVSKGYWRVIAEGRIFPSSLQKAAVLQTATALNSMWQQAAGSTQHQAASPRTPLWRFLPQSTSDENPPCEHTSQVPSRVAIWWHYIACALFNKL